MGSRNTTVEPEYLDGIHVAGSVLWLDSPRLAELCFVSHVLLRPSGPQRRLLLSERTWQLMGGGRAGSGVLAVPFFHRFSVGPLDLQLVPSGYLPGASQLIIDREGRRLVYSGDFCLLRRMTAEKAQPHPADVLILRTQLPPGIVFPEPARVEAHVLDWVDGLRRQGRTALFLVDEAAVALELAAWLRAQEVTVHLHRDFFTLAWRARGLGVPLSGIHRQRTENTRPQVLLWPWRLRRSPALRRLEAVTTMAVGAAAALPGAATRLGVQEVACLSQLADQRQIEEYLEAARGAKIYLTGRSAARWGEWLTGRGQPVSLLAPPRQLPLFDKLQAEEDNELSTPGSGDVTGGN